MYNTYIDRVRRVLSSGSKSHNQRFKTSLIHAIEFSLIFYFTHVIFHFTYVKNTLKFLNQFMTYRIYPAISTNNLAEN